MCHETKMKKRSTGAPKEAIEERGPIYPHLSIKSSCCCSVVHGGLLLSGLRLTSSRAFFFRPLVRCSVRVSFILYF